MKRLLQWLGIIKKPLPSNGFVGYWGAWTPETDESKILGEMYKYEGRWIAGPEIYTNSEPLDKEFVDKH